MGQELEILRGIIGDKKEVVSIKFIYVLDESLKNKLIKLGNKMLYQKNIDGQKCWIFENSSIFNFDKNDMKKCFYSDILTFS